MKVYLDVCCLNRLFDDQQQPRVFLEAAAVTSILQLIDEQRLTDCSSEMAIIEIGRMRDADRRRKVTALLPAPKQIISLDDSLLDLADSLITIGFDLADAVHLAAASTSNADVLLTVNDKFLKRAARNADKIRCKVMDPVRF